MAQPLLALQYGTGSVVQPLRGQGSSAISLGGPLRREATFTDSRARVQTHRVVQTPDNRVFCAYAEADDATIKVYELDRDALAVFTTADPTGGTTLPKRGDRITGDTSGAVGTLIEDYRAGDNFINFVPTSGTFQDAEGVTIDDTLSGSGSGTNTATLTASGNPEDNSGEWGVHPTGETTDVVDAAGGSPCYTGLHKFITGSGKIGLALIFASGLSNDIFAFEWDPDTDAWTETNLGTFSAYQMGGQSYSRNGVIHTVWTANNAPQNFNSKHVIAYNPATGSISTDPMGCRNDTRASICEWDGDLYHLSDQATTLDIRLHKITGGSNTIIDTITGTNTFGQIHHLIVGPDDNALYGFLNESGGLFVLRWHKDENGNIVRDVLEDTDDANHLGSVVLPASLQSGLSTEQHIAQFADLHTTPGSVDNFFWVSDNGAAFVEYKYVGYTNLDGGAAATIGNVSSLTADITFSADPGLVVGDWVRVVDTNQIFRVTAIAVGGDARVVSITGITGNAPVAGTSVIQKANQWSEESSSGGLIGVAMPSDFEGSGAYVYTAGERHPTIVGIVGLPGAEEISYVPRSDTGTDVVTISGYIFTKDRQVIQMSLSNPSEGTQSGQTITGVTADGSVKTADWDSDGDGAPTQDFRRLLFIS